MVEEWQRQWFGSEEDPHEYVSLRIKGLRMALTVNVILDNGNHPL
jgi:hypothetical protein